MNGDLSVLAVAAVVLGTQVWLSSTLVAPRNNRAIILGSLIIKPVELPTLTAITITAILVFLPGLIQLAFLAVALGLAPSGTGSGRVIAFIACLVAAVWYVWLYRLARGSDLGNS